MEYMLISVAIIYSKQSVSAINHKFQVSNQNALFDKTEFKESTWKTVKMGIKSNEELVHQI